MSAFPSRSHSCPRLRPAGRVRLQRRQAAQVSRVDKKATHDRLYSLLFDGGDSRSPGLSRLSSPMHTRLSDTISPISPANASVMEESDSVVLSLSMKSPGARGDVGATAEERITRRIRPRSSSVASETAASSTALTTLIAAGGSIATASRREPSLISAASLVVHEGQGVEQYSSQERLRLYLAGEIPELNEHVDAYVEARAEEVRRKIDDELADQFMHQMQRRDVFDGRANALRWQNVRRVTLQRRLEEEMPKWVWEAVTSWDHPKESQAREAQVNETDLIFDYLTKRAAHIDTTKLATEIPIFKTMHASYSLPTMWRDKYLE